MARIITDEKKINNLLSRGVTEVIDREHLKKALLSGKQLRVKLGFDPTGDKIHIGRAIALRKLRDFQNLGHKIIFLIGDFTALIGDPSDKLSKRPMLREEQVRENLRDYKRQIGKILDLSKTKFVFNGKWLGKLRFGEILQLAESFSVNQMLSRRNFKARFEKGEEISLREFMYPLMQGYDSVVIKADVEVAGFDQLFNVKAARVIQPHYKQAPQNILTTEMLEGTDGRKMSTSWGNVINITDEPEDMFGKLMSLKDDLIERYFLLCTDLEEDEIKTLSGSAKEKKMRLAYEITKIYHGEKLAEKAKQDFVGVFVKKEIPQDIETLKLGFASADLITILVKAKLADSRSEGRRLIEQGGVRVEGEKILDTNASFDIIESKLIQVGPRRFVKVVRK